MKPLRHFPQLLRRAAFCLLFLAATFVLQDAAHADVQPAGDYTVNTLADTDDGSCDLAGTGPGNQGCSLREAINAAKFYGDGAKIGFSVSGTIVLGSTLPLINTAMSIDGSAQSVVISGNGSVQIFQISTTNDRKTIDLNALTIAHGSSNRGAIHARYATINFTNCTFHDNKSVSFGLGGAMYLDSASTVTVANSTFYNNSARYGGAIYIVGGPGAASFLSVYNSTFADNKLVSPPANSGANIHADNAAVAITNSILVKDEAQSTWRNCTNVGSADAHTFANDNTCGSPVVTRAQLNLDALKDNGGPTKTMALLAGSVAANAGNNSVCNAAPINNQDQRGYDRIRSGDATCDSGAYEAGSSGSLQVTTVADAVSTANRQTSLREALAYAHSLGGPQTITFAPSLAGRTVTLNTGSIDANDPSALRIFGQITLQGLTTSPGVTIGIAPEVYKRHLYVLPGGDLTVSHLTFANGTGPDYGGSIWSQGALTVRHCTFVGNTAGAEGGAIQSWGDSPSLSIENSTFGGNRSQGNGSAVNCGASSMTFRYVTIAANGATSGHAVVIYKNQLTMVNSIIAGNEENGEGIGSVNGGMLNTAESTNNLLGLGGTGGLSNGVNGNRTGVTAQQLDIDALENNGGPTATFRLGGNSIAIDAGVNIAGVTADQRGIPRPQLSAPDVGAFELAPGAGSLVVTTAVDENNGTSDPGFGNGTSLREAFIFAQSAGGAQTITFAPQLAGQAVTLSNAWDNTNGFNSSSAIRVDGHVTIEGPMTAPGITLNVGGVAQVRHFVISSGGTLVLKNLTLTGGKPALSGFDFGGAIWNFGSLSVRDCTFTGNTAGAEGGAIHSWGGSPSLLIDNTTITGNSSGSNGSAIGTGATQNTFRHLTVTGNTGPNSIWLYETSATMLNTILAGNSNDTVAFAGAGTFSSASTNNILSSGTAPGLTNGVNENQLGIPVNQLWLGALADNGGPTPTIALRPGSLAIDAGVMTGGLTSDQRGTERPQQSLPDIGAFELVQVQAATPVINPPEGGFEHAVQVSITTSPNALIRYTLGGEEPTPTAGELYTGPFWVTNSRSVLAIAYGRGWLPSQVTIANMTVREPLDHWESLHQNDFTGHFDNPSGDGVVNLLKYAFNLAPSFGDLLRSNNQVLTPEGDAGLPSITRDAQGRLMLQFLRRKATTNPGVTYIPESSADLLTWTPLPLTNATVVSVDSVWERVTVVDPVFTARRFGRVSVTTLGSYYNDFDRGPGPASKRGSAKFVNGAVELTDGLTGGQLGSLVLDDIELGEAPPEGTELSGFTARFNVILGPSATGTPGDGLSFAVGELPAAPSDPFDPSDPPPAPPWGETGPGTSHSLAVGFDTYENGGAGSIGIHVWVNGVHVAASPVNPYTNGALVPVEITWEANSALTVKFNGATIFDRLPISGFRLRGSGGETHGYSDDDFGFGARTGGAVQRAVVDDVQIEPRF